MAEDDPGWNWRTQGNRTNDKRRALRIWLKQRNRGSMPVSDLKSKNQGSMPQSRLKSKNQGSMRLP